MKRWRRWYPKSWRARYGDEYEQLLEDLDAEHRLSGRDQFDVYRSGLVLRWSSAGSGRRIVVCLMVIIILATGIGLGVGLGDTARSPGETYVAPLLPNPPIARTWSGDQLDFILSVTCSPNVAYIDGLAGGTSGLRTTASPSLQLGPTREVSSGVADGLPWSIFAALPSLARPLAVEQLAYGGIVIEGHSYSVCSLLRQSEYFSQSDMRAGDVGEAVFEPVNIKGRGVVFGVTPARTSLSLSLDGQPGVHAIDVGKQAGGLSLFLAVFPKPACGDFQIRYSDASLEGVWEGHARFESLGCTTLKPLSATAWSVISVGVRNRGTVTAIRPGEIVVSNEVGPPLHVDVSTATHIFEQGTKNNPVLQARCVVWLPSSVGQIHPNDAVYIAGTISATTATASAVYVYRPPTHDPLRAETGQAIIC